MTIDFSELTFNTIGDWPIVIRVFIVVFACVAIISAGLWFSTRPQMQKLDTAEKEQIELKQQFESKQAVASSLDEYKRQMVEMQKSFGDMLQQLPATHEIPSLLEEISETGIRNGLEFKLFKPGNEQQFDFYVELPIEIQVIGSYHQLADFVSDLANMRRIVSLHDFKIIDFGANPRGRGGKGEDAGDEKVGKLLDMSITAKTYRYLGEMELQAVEAAKQMEAEANSKKKGKNKKKKKK